MVLLRLQGVQRGALESCSRKMLQLNLSCDRATKVKIKRANEENDWSQHQCSIGKKAELYVLRDRITPGSTILQGQGQ